MRITQWGEYGVHCCIFLAQQHELGRQTLSAAEIAESQTIDLQYTQQILQRLRKNGIVQSVRGPQGGYRLSRAAAEITLLDILVAEEGETFQIICETKPLTSERCSPGALCNLRPVWYELREHIDDFLQNITLDQLMRPRASAARPVRINAVRRGL